MISEYVLHPNYLQKLDPLKEFPNLMEDLKEAAKIYANSFTKLPRLSRDNDNLTFTSVKRIELMTQIHLKMIALKLKNTNNSMDDLVKLK